MWECQWKQFFKINPAIKLFLEKKDKNPKRVTPSCGKGFPLTEKQIMDAVLDETCFGLVEWESQIILENFSEMTPIFLNIYLTWANIGVYMQDYARQNKLLTTARRTLIGSLVGEKILLATPLLKWYLTHELDVTKVYQVIEYNPVTCFKTFNDKVSNARIQGD
jgi:hypothetical protein